MQSDIRCTMSSSVACLAISYICTLSYIRYDFLEKKKFIEYKMCVLIFSTTFV